MNQLSTYETAKLAKEAGFCNKSEDTHFFLKERKSGMILSMPIWKDEVYEQDMHKYEDLNLLRPQLTTLQDYALEKWGIWVEVRYNGVSFEYVILNLKTGFIVEKSGQFKTKDEALEQGIQVALKEKIKEGL